MRESKIESYFKQQVEAAGAESRKCRWLCRSGAPDRYTFGWPAGRTAFCELKAPGEKPKPHQRREMRRLRDAGLECYTIDSLEAVDVFIKEMTSARTDPFT